MQMSGLFVNQHRCNERLALCGKKCVFNHLAGHIYAHHIIQAQLLGIYMQGFTAKFAKRGGFQNI